MKEGFLVSTLAESSSVVNINSIQSFCKNDYDGVYSIYFSFVKNSASWKYKYKEHRDYELAYLTNLLGVKIPPMPEPEVPEIPEEKLVKKEPKDVYVYRKEKDFFVTNDKSTIDFNMHFEKAKYLE